MAAMNKAQREAVIRKLRRAIDAAKEDYVEKHKKEIKLNKDEKLYIDLFNKEKSLEKELDDVRNLIEEKRRELNIPNGYFNRFNPELMTDEKYIDEYKLHEIIPDKLKHFDFDECEDNLIINNVKDFNVDEYIKNIIKNLK